MRIQLGHKFVLGSIAVVGSVVLIPYGIGALDLPDWARGVIPTLAAIAVGLSIGNLFTRTIARSVRLLGRATRLIAEGDLRHNVELGRRVVSDELDDLATSINGMLQALQQMVVHIVRTSSNVAASAQNLSATAEEINASSEEIAVTMEEVARGVEHQKASVEKMAELIRAQDHNVDGISRTCREAAASARAAEGKAQEGSRTARETFQHLDGVLQRLEGTAAVFLAFSDKIQQIHRMAEVITNLSRQTNLLALNAAIEASKAGEEGKGFAVVASEIRKLADSAERSADQISGMVGKLDEETREVRRRMEDTGKQVAGGREGLQTAGNALEEITRLVAEDTRHMEGILELTQVQAEASRQVVAFADQIQQVAESNAAATHQVSTTIEHQTSAMEDMATSAMRLSQMAEDLNRRVERFRVPEATEAG